MIKGKRKTVKRSYCVFAFKNCRTLNTDKTKMGMGWSVDLLSFVFFSLRICKCCGHGGTKWLSTTICQWVSMSVSLVRSTNVYQKRCIEIVHWHLNWPHSTLKQRPPVLPGPKALTISRSACSVVSFSNTGFPSATSWAWIRFEKWSIIRYRCI